MVRALALLATLSLALASPVEAKKAPKAAEQTFTSTMSQIAGMGEVIAKNKIQVRVFENEKARAILALLFDLLGNQAVPKPTVQHVIVLLDDRQGLIMVFEGEKLAVATADKPEIFKALLLAWDKAQV